MNRIEDIDNKEEQKKFPACVPSRILSLCSLKFIFVDRLKEEEFFLPSQTRKLEYLLHLHKQTN